MYKLLIKPTFLALALTISLAGCLEGENLVSGLSGAESREILLELARFEVPAERVKEANKLRGNFYKINVPEGYYHSSLSILKALNLPKRSKTASKFSSSSSGLPRADRVKLQYSSLLAANLEELLESFPGIVEVKALVVPQGEEPKSSPAKASLAVRYIKERLPLSFRDSKSANYEINLEKLKEIVSNALPGEKADNLKKESIYIEASKTELSKSLLKPTLGASSSLFSMNLSSSSPPSYLLALCSALIFLSFYFLLKALTDKNKRRGGHGSLGQESAFLVEEEIKSENTSNQGKIANL